MLEVEDILNKYCGANTYISQESNCSSNNWKCMKYYFTHFCMSKKVILDPTGLDIMHMFRLKSIRL